MSVVSVCQYVSVCASRCQYLPVMSVCVSDLMVLVCVSGVSGAVVSVCISMCQFNNGVSMCQYVSVVLVCVSVCQ